MAMDVRDAMFWASEAKRKGLVRLAQMYNAALLPQQKEETIRREMGGLRVALEETGREDEIAEAEMANAERIMAFKEKRKRMRKKGKKRPKRKAPSKSSKVRSF